MHDAIVRIQCTCITAVQQLLNLVREKLLLSQQTQRNTLNASSQYNLNKIMKEGMFVSKYMYIFVIIFWHTYFIVLIIHLDIELREYT